MDILDTPVIERVDGSWYYTVATNCIIFVQQWQFNTVCHYIPNYLIYMHDHHAGIINGTYTIHM